MKSSRKPLAGWLGVVALLALGSYFSWKALRDAKPAGLDQGPMGGPPPATVIVHPAELKEIAETLSVTGTLRAVRRAEIAALEGAAVKEVFVDEGVQVKKGDPIARLDGRRLIAQSQEAKAALSVAEARLAEADAELARATRDMEMMEKLWDEQAVSEREFLDSQRGLGVAIAVKNSSAEGIDAAKKRMELFDVRIADLEVFAPFDGRVVARHVELGEWVQEGEPLVTLVSTGEIEAWLQLPERHALKVADTPPNAIILRLPGRKAAVHADKIQVVPDIDGRSRLFTVIVHVPEADDAFTPGTSVTAIVPLGAVTPRTTVPVDAVLKGFSGSYVFVPDGSPPIAKRVDVEVLFERGGESILADGALEAGQDVIIEGNERLFPGSPVSPQVRGQDPVAAGNRAADDSASH